MSRRNVHPDLSPRERRRLFFEGIELFNGGEFFESHESWEEIWRSTTPEPRDLFQGLIQIAAAMHHYVDRGKTAPAAWLLERARRRLEPFAPVRHGLDLADLLAAVERWESWLAAPEGEPPAVPRLVVLDPEAVE